MGDMKVSGAFCFFISLLLLLVGLSSAQTLLTGRVLDASDGQALPSATIQIKGSARGTVTNGDGRFEIAVLRFPVTLQIRFIGYRSIELDVAAPSGSVLEVQLQPVSVTLDELVVTGENPAYNIMRQVLLAKERMRAHLTATYADTYTRFMLYSEMNLVQMNESVRATWWTPTAGTRELIRAERSSPKNSGSFRFATPHAVSNFYDDDIEIMGTRFAGPLHPKALDMYVFTLGEIRIQDGKKVFDIYFSPQSPTLPAFTGHVAVLDSVFTALEINLRPHPSTNVLPPVQQHEIYLEQRFVSFGDSLWLPISLHIQGLVSFGRTGVQYPTARYEQISGLSLQVVNPPVPDSLSIRGLQVVRHPLADRRDELFARNPSFIPLTPKEAEVLATMKPGMTIERAFRPEGLLRQYAAFPITEEKEEAISQPSSRFALAYQIAGGDWFWFNRVDGWHPGFSYGSKPNSPVTWRTSLGYSTMRKRITHREQIKVPWKVGVISGNVGVEYLDATSVIARDGDLGRFIPGFATYLGYNDLYDYYSHRAATLNLDLTPSNKPVLLSFRAHSEVHESLEKLSNFNGWLFHTNQRENPAIRPGDLRSLEVVAKIGSEFNRSIEVSYERSPGSAFGSDWSFERFEAKGTFRFETFYRRRAHPNWFRITVLGGTSTGNLPIQRQFTLSGSAGPYSSFSGFRTLKSSRFVADRVGGIFWAHDFTTALFEKLGLWGLADTGMGLYVFGGHAFSSRVEEIGEFGGRFHEIGLGISHPLGMPFRIELATGSDGGYSFRFGRPLK